MQLFNNSFQGISIDRQDHTREYNYNISSNVSLCLASDNSKYIECTLMLISYKSMAKLLTNVIHNSTYTQQLLHSNPIITENYYGSSRVDLNIISDVIFSEGYDVNALGLSSLMRPAILWTYNTNELFSISDNNNNNNSKEYSPHIYFQRNLYLNVGLMAPCIGNDHSILPNTTAQYYYNMYGNLFKVLRGTVWWLQSNTIEIMYQEEQSKQPLMNSFINQESNELIFVFVLGNMNMTNEMININVTGAENQVTSCQYINPNQNQDWKTLTIVNKTVVNNIMLAYGCALVKCVQ